MRIGIPLLPIGLVVVILAVTSALLMVPRTSLETRPMPFVETRAPLTVASLSTGVQGLDRDDEMAVSSVDHWLDRSPWIADRSAYQSPPPVEIKQVRQPYTPVLVGTVSRGSQKWALIQWHPHQPDVASFSIDDETPWGRVLQISGAHVRFHDGRSISLFDE